MANPTITVKKLPNGEYIGTAKRGRRILGITRPRLNDWLAKEDAEVIAGLRTKRDTQMAEAEGFRACLNHRLQVAVGIHSDRHTAIICLKGVKLIDANEKAIEFTGPATALIQQLECALAELRLAVEATSEDKQALKRVNRGTR
jgi:hypothetical protein